MTTSGEKKARERVDREIDRVGAQAQLLSGRRGIDGTLKPKQVGGKKEVKSDFEDFIEQVENGFSGKKGLDPNKPYGKPKSQRPKIRILE